MKSLFTVFLTLGTLTAFSQTVPYHFPSGPRCIVLSEKVTEIPEAKKPHQFNFQLDLEEKSKTSTIKVGLRKYETLDTTCGERTGKKGWVRDSFYYQTFKYTFKIDPSSKIDSDLILPVATIVNDAEETKVYFKGKSSYDIVVDYDDKFIGTQIDGNDMKEEVTEVTLLFKLTPKQ